MKSLSLSLVLLFLSHFTLAQINEVPEEPETQIIESAPTEPKMKEAIKPFEVFEEEGLQGLKVSGEVKIKAIYKSIKALRQKTYFIAKTEEGYFLINQNGEILSSKAYTAIKDVFRLTSYFSNSEKKPSRYNETPKEKPLFQVTEDKLVGVIDENGKLLIPIEYDELRPYKAKKNGKWGAIDLDNKILIPFEYEDIGDFKMTNWAIAKKEDKKGIIDVNGNVVVPIKYEDLEVLGKDFLKIKEDGKYKLLDLEGDQILPGAYDKLSYWNTGVFQVEENGLHGIFDQEGNELLKPIYNELFPYRFNHFIAKKENRVGVFLPSDGWVVPLEYSKLTPAGMRQVPLLIATKSEKKGIVDLKNKILLPFEYDHIDKLEDGFARAQKNGKWGFIELNTDLQSFKVVVDFIYDEVEPFTLGIMEFVKNGVKGVLVWKYKTRTIEESNILKPE